MKKIRHPDWDYSWNGIYYVTLKTKNNRNYFGQIEEQKMYLNEVGQIAEQCWKDIVNHHEHVYLDEYIIMPEHLHGIIRINNPEKEEGYYLMRRKSNKIQIPENNTGSNPNLMSIVGSFKSACSKIIRAETYCLSFSWQKRFYDEIIVNDLVLMRVREYIIHNPRNYCM